MIEVVMPQLVKRNRVPVPTGTPIAKPTPIFTKVDVEALLAED